MRAAAAAARAADASEAVLDGVTAAAYVDAGGAHGCGAVRWRRCGVGAAGGVTDVGCAA